MNFDAMAEAAAFFTGGCDFASFAASTGTDEDDMERVTLRTIYQSTLIRVPIAGNRDAAEEWIYVVRGPGHLCCNLVRKMVGTLSSPVSRGEMANARYTGTVRAA